MIYRASPQRYRTAVASLEKTYRASPQRYRAAVASLEKIYRASPQRYRAAAASLESDLPRQPATLPRRCRITIVPVYAVGAPFQRRGK